MIATKSTISSKTKRTSRSTNAKKTKSERKQNNKTFIRKKPQKSRKSPKVPTTVDTVNPKKILRTKKLNAIRVLIDNAGKFPPTKSDWDIYSGWSTITMDQLTFGSSFCPRTLFSSNSNQYFGTNSSLAKLSNGLKCLEDLKDLPVIPGKYFKINEYFEKTRSKRKSNFLVKEDHVYLKDNKGMKRMFRCYKENDIKLDTSILQK